MSATVTTEPLNPFDGTVGDARTAHRPLKVLYVIDHVSTVGGAERFVVGLAQHMPRTRVEPWVCSTRAMDRSAAALLSDAGVACINLGRSTKWDVHRLLGLASLIRRQRFDVVHAHKFGSNVWATLIASACEVPVVVAQEHTWAYSGNRLRLWLDRHLVGRLATRFVAVSNRDRERMIAIEGVPEAKAMVMPVPHIPHEASQSADIRSELGLEAKVPVLATAAVLRPQKAFEVLLQAHARVLEAVPDAQLIIAGDGPCRSELEELVERLGIAASVHMLGRRTDVDAILRRVDVGVMSSDFEGMPQFVFECMAAGIPIVATAVGGLPEIVRDGHTGLLVPPRDPSALARALTDVLTDKALARRLASASAARRDEFTITSVAGKYAALYETLVEGIRSSGTSRGESIGEEPVSWNH